MEKQGTMKMSLKIAPPNFGNEEENDLFSVSYKGQLTPIIQFVQNSEQKDVLSMTHQKNI